MDIRFLTVEEVLLFHEMQIARFGGYALVIGVCEGTVTKGRLAEALREGSAPLPAG